MKITIGNYPISRVRKNVVNEMQNKGYQFVGFKKIKDNSMWGFGDFIVKKIILKLKNYLKQIGCTHFFFSQDDTFSSADNKTVDWNELISYIKRYEREFMLSLYNKNTVLNFEGEVEKQNTFNIYKSTTLDFYNSDKTPWPLDDTPYICTSDLIDEIYDEEYLSYGNIWDAEEFLREKYRIKEINRFVTDKKIFQNYNLYGKTTYMEIVFRKILKTNGLI